MREQIIALDDIWWTCLLCGRTKKKITEPVAKVTAKQPQQTWAGCLAKQDRPPQRDGKGDYMSKTLSDLNDALFSQLDRLTADGLTGENLKTEIDRSRTVSNLAREIIENGKLSLEAQRTLGGKKGNPKLLGLTE